MTPARGEIWLADLDPVRGHEQAGRRPVLIISHDRFNQSLAHLAVVLTLTTVDKAMPYHGPHRSAERRAPFSSLYQM